MIKMEIKNYLLNESIDVNKINELNLYFKKQIKEVPGKMGVYFFTNESNETLYVGSSSNLKKRMYHYFYTIKKGENNHSQQDLMSYLKNNTFFINYILEEDYLSLEEEKRIELNPIFNKKKAKTGIVNYVDFEDYHKQWRDKYREHFLDYKRQYNNRVCFFNGKKTTLNALTLFFKKQGFVHSTQEAKKYLV